MNYKRRYDKNHCILQKGESQRSDGVYMFRWTDEYGKRRCLYATNLDDLRLKEQKRELNRLEGIKEPPACLTVERLYETWKDLKRGIKDTTRSGYIQIFESQIAPSFGKKLVVKVKRSNVRAFYISLMEEKGLSVATVERVHNVLQQVFQFAVDDDILRKNPCDRVLKELKASYIHLASAKRKALTLKQENNFLRFLYEHDRYLHWYPVFFIMANTGLRVGEITGLRWRDVDLENGFIDVNHTLVYFDHRDSKGCYYSINTPKTENGKRRVMMTQAVKEAFIMEKKYQEMADLESLDVINGYEDFVFINRFGHVQNQAGLNKAIQRAIRDFNSIAVDKGKTDPDDLLPHFSCHVLRHTYATRLIESGCSLKFVQASMGHSEIQTTMDIYVSVTEEFQHNENSAYEEYMKTAFSVTPSADKIS